MPNDLDGTSNTINVASSQKQMPLECVMHSKGKLSGEHGKKCGPDPLEIGIPAQDLEDLRGRRNGVVR